jgi:hypothetical protein
MKPAVMTLALCAVAPSATAQLLPRPLPPVEPCCSPGVMPTTPDPTSLPTRPTTFGERALFGLIGGIGATFGMGAAFQDGPPAEIFVPGYALASALGVELVALPHEGARPLGALLGAVAGTGLGLLTLASSHCDYCDDPPPGVWFGVAAYALAVPLMAAAGHGLDPRLRGRRPPEQLPVRAEPGALLRIEDLEGDRTSGQVLEVSDSTIALRRWVAVALRGTVYDTLAFRLDSIGHAWVRTGSNWQRGLLIGTGLGAALGLTALAFDDPGGAPESATFTATFLTFLGGALGTIVGATNTRWEPTPLPSGVAHR